MRKRNSVDSRTKGKRAEYQVRDRFQRLGLRAERVPLSGSSRLLKGDVALSGGLKVEVKSRKDDFRRIYRWLKDSDILVLKSDRKPYLVVMTFEALENLIKEVVQCQRRVEDQE